MIKIKEDFSDANKNVKQYKDLLHAVFPTDSEKNERHSVDEPRGENNYNDWYQLLEAYALVIHLMFQMTDLSTTQIISFQDACDKLKDLFF